MPRNPARSEPTQYVVARLREALAHDERVAALDVNVRIIGDEVFLTGSVPTRERREACGQIIGELLPDSSLHNQLSVVEHDAPSGIEDLA